MDLFFWLQIMFEDGGIEFLDMSKEEWELVTLWYDCEASANYSFINAFYILILSPLFPNFIHTMSHTRVC